MPTISMESAVQELSVMFPQHNQAFLRDLITQNRISILMELFLDGNMDHVITILVSLSSDERTTHYPPAV